MSKKCISCGAELPDSASFCPSCAHSQSMRKELKAPYRWWKKAKALALIALACATVVLIFTQYRELKTYKGGAEVVYSDNGKQYHVLLSFYRIGSSVQTQPMPEMTNKMPTGNTRSVASQLYIYEEGNHNEDGIYNDIQAEFMENVASCRVSVLPQGGGEQMTYSAPAPDKSFSTAAMVSSVDYWAECKTNEIVWTLDMKNGDTIILRHKINVELLSTLDYRPESTPMETIEDLQTLLNFIRTDIDKGTLVNIYLPPVVYEGGLEINSRAITIYGSTSGNTVTTFTEPTLITTEHPDSTKIYGVRFAGSGGIGISATAGLSLYDCILIGWDTAAFSRDGSLISAHGCTFEKNGVGLHFASQRASYIDLTYDKNNFLNNGIGILIDALPTVGLLNFEGSLFSGNSVDIQNPTEVPIDTSGATFE